MHLRSANFHVASSDSFGRKLRRDARRGEREEILDAVDGVPAGWVLGVIGVGAILEGRRVPDTHFG